FNLLFKIDTTLFVNKLFLVSLDFTTLFTMDMFVLNFCPISISARVSLGKQEPPKAGPAYGGSCFPKDTRALIDIGQKFRINMSIVKSVVKSNDLRKSLFTKRVVSILNNKLKNKRITFLGVTFKPNTDDIRESSSLVIIPALVKAGAILKVHDPAYTKYFNHFKEFKEVKWNRSVFNAIKDSDLVIIHTEWNEYRALDLKKTKKILKHPNILDLRNIFNKSEMIKLGFNYKSIGNKE
ncbi:MAG: hypothetical protein CMP24_06540, partial [Rickettsiales bacterium]|nr:hypothetical protein [Rickettsiales bacterium]